MRAAPKKKKKKNSTHSFDKQYRELESDREIEGARTGKKRERIDWPTKILKPNG